MELQKYQPHHKERLQDFSLPPEQMPFTALPVDRLEGSNGEHPIVILYERKPVGFFLLHSGERVNDYTDLPNRMLLTSFSVNFSDQGKGYAKGGLKLLKAFVQQEFPDCAEVILAVNHRNIAAQNLYIKTGFFDTGNRKTGKIGEQYIFSLPIL
ncbi:GNAT family N-acetyltransferase [Bacillus sp. FJAT-42376]|uniref:GNAT family N-acetyltransferase n=1 Tax=Bacillus sp. FJAT-42376 TaxID=2014076 RepID=UPI000F4DD817|nr:GNAT family N-acetyltransferase [Bacillus sp. FJAT-42376]AZB43432.1 GNAT family N-acetyltransferase [Bacillus sp. FJAT-42376]